MDFINTKPLIFTALFVGLLAWLPASAAAPDQAAPGFTLSGSGLAVTEVDADLANGSAQLSVDVPGAIHTALLYWAVDCANAACDDAQPASLGFQNQPVSGLRVANPKPGQWRAYRGHVTKLMDSTAPGRHDFLVHGPAAGAKLVIIYTDAQDTQSYDLMIYDQTALQAPKPGTDRPTWALSVLSLPQPQPAVAALGIGKTNSGKPLQRRRAGRPDNNCCLNYYVNGQRHQWCQLADRYCGIERKEPRLPAGVKASINIVSSENRRNGKFVVLDDRGHIARPEKNNLPGKSISKFTIELIQVNPCYMRICRSTTCQIRKISNGDCPEGTF